MKLSEFIVDTRKELDRAQEEKNTQGIVPKYKINKVILEIYAEGITDKHGGIDFKIVNFGAKLKDKNYHKVSIELKPLR